MARSSRISRTLPELLEALDHHQFLLRQNLHGLRHDPAHIKILASELRTLTCLSSGTEGLLWRVADELSISDLMQLRTGGQSVNRDHPLSHGLAIAKIPLWRADEGPPGLPTGEYRLRDIIKTHEAIYVAQISDTVFTHELLIKAIAEQMGGAHESEGLDYSLVKLSELLINERELYFSVLAFDAELTLQIGERVLDHAEKCHSFQRASRSADCGDFTLAIRFALVQPILGYIPLICLRSPIAEATVSCLAGPRLARFVFEKRGTTVVELEAAYPPDWENNTDAIFAVSYTSAHRQARTITNDKENDPAINCDFGWLDAREFSPPQSHQGCEAFFNVKCIPLYDRLLSPKECGDLLKISPDMSELLAHDPRTGPFPS